MVQARVLDLGWGGGGHFVSKEEGRRCRDLVSWQNRNFIKVGSLNSKYVVGIVVPNRIFFFVIEKLIWVLVTG